MTFSQWLSSRGALGGASAKAASKASSSARNSDIQNSRKGADSCSGPKLGNMVTDIASIHHVVGGSDGRGSLDIDQAQNLADHGSALRRFWRWLVRTNARIDACWIGDLIGVAGLFVLLTCGLIMVPVLK